MNHSQTALLTGLAVTFNVTGLVQAQDSATETALAPLKDLATESANKRKGQSFFAVKGGTTTGQSGEMEIEGLAFDLLETDGSFAFGLELGYAWQLKKLPLEFALSFEGGYIDSELNGTLRPGQNVVTPPVTEGGMPVNSIADTAINSVSTDMNLAYFLFNGRLSLDLWRYRARLGRNLTRIKPYIGGGVGGGQLWYRNVTTTSVGMANDPANMTTAIGDPFSTDQFVLAYQWFAGVEVRVTDKVSIFGERRSITFEDVVEVSDLQLDTWQAGVKIAYDKKVEE